MSHHTPLTDTDVQSIADAADVNPRSVLRALAGLPVRGRAGARIARVLAERGITPRGTVPEVSK